MKLIPTIKIATAATRANAVRSLLASLGIAIAVSAVMMMVAVGNGAQQEIQDGISTLGANVIHVYSGENKVGVRSDGAGSRPSFTEDDLHAILLKAKGIRTGSGSLRAPARIVSDNANWQTNVEGINSGFLVARDWAIDKGRGFTEIEEHAGEKVALLGATVALKLFDGRNPIGLSVRIGRIPFRVIGILDRKGQTSSGHDTDDVVLIPVKAARSYLAIPHKLQSFDVGNLVIKVKSGVPTAIVRNDIEQILRARRKIKSDADDDFLVRDLTEYLSTKAAAQKTLGFLLAAAAAITLLVGGIGIMNVMLVSVTERTKEIGLRLAIGAQQADIMGQFLTEALILCSIGCGLGLTLGYVGTLGLNEALDWDVQSSMRIASVAVLSAIGTTVIFGFIPAYKAARLNPMRALLKE